MLLSKKMTTFVDLATIEDIKALVAIHAKSFERGWQTSEFQSLLGDKTVKCFALRLSTRRITDQIVGFVLLRSVLDEAEILTIAVDPDYRKKGVGRALMEETLRKLYADRAAKLFLEVDANNQPALSLYTKLGFKKIGERQGYYRSDKDQAATAWVMQVEVRGRAGLNI